MVCKLEPDRGVAARALLGWPLSLHSVVEHSGLLAVRLNCCRLLGRRVYKCAKVVGGHMISYDPS